MPPSDQESSSVPFSAIRRVISSIRSDQVHAMEMNKDANAQNAQFELFQNHVFDRFHDLAEATPDEFLSIAWIQRLLGVFFSCLEEFRVLLSNNGDCLQKPVMDKILSEFFDKSIKALDICNAIRDGLEKIRVWQKHLEIVLSALGSKQKAATGEGNFRRARKALMELSLMMLDAKESGTSSAFSNRNRSFGRHNSVGGKDRESGHSRSLSWSVSRSWSASKQLQSMANNLVPPRGNEVVASNGLANPTYTMSAVVMFVLWTLVAAIPCQDRGGVSAHFSFGRQLVWATPLVAVQERIMEEGRRRENRSCSGLLKEVADIERCVRRLTELVDSVSLPVRGEKKEEVGKVVEELERIVNAFRKSNDPLERQLRQIFHKIMSCRTEGLALMRRK